MTATWVKTAKLFAMTWISVMCVDSGGLAWAQNHARPFVENAPQNSSHSHFSDDPAINRMRTGQTHRSLPEWNAYWQAVESSVVQSDGDCGIAAPSCYDPMHFSFYESRSDTFDSRRNSSNSDLHSAYSRSYRSRMPSLDQVRRDETCYDHDSYEPDLFGSYQPSDRLGSKSFSGGRGQWFGRYEALLAWPYYSNGHSGMNIESGSLTISEPFEYNLIYGNRGVVGWESAKGPGGMLQYTDIFAVSQRLTAGVAGGTTNVSGLVSVPGLTTPFSTD